MICYILGAAPVSDPSYIHFDLHPDDCVICADGGYRLAKALGIEPNWLVGDFDSNREEVNVSRTIRVKPQKDDTDLYLAVSHGRELGYTKFVIFGGLGGRFDHSIANVQMLKGMIEEGIHITMLDEQNEIFALKDGSVVLPKGDYTYFSVFSLTEHSTVTLIGAAYPLDRYLLTSSFPLGVSNEVKEKEATIIVENGTLLIVRSKDGNQF